LINETGTSRIMTSGPTITLDELIEIRGVKGAYEVDADGFLLGSIDTGAQDRDAVAAVAAVTAISSERIGEVLGLGGLVWVLLEFSAGKMLMARQGTKIWVVVANNHVLLGDVIMKLRNPEKAD
jgi:predicted regulator of Ras-like GTPase activity (Roadblock/LC7/MglB family)